MVVRSMILAAVVVITTATPAGAAPVRQTAAGTSGPADVTVTRAGDLDAAKCDAGSFCAWSGANYTGKVARLNLETATPNQCVVLPDKLVAKSLANLMTRDVSVYEGAACSTEAEFTTYPKGGTYVPDAPFVVRAIQVWE